jgi:hypothetical protein
MFVIRERFYAHPVEISTMRRPRPDLGLCVTEKLMRWAASRVRPVEGWVAGKRLRLIQDWL